jgi:hypothetical protein
MEIIVLFFQLEYNSAEKHLGSEVLIKNFKN